MTKNHRNPLPRSRTPFLLIPIVLLIWLWLLSVVNASPLLDALAQVESGGRPSAIGDGGKARGAFQIWAGAWEDVSRERAKSGKPVYAYSEAVDMGKAREYARDYIRILTSSYTAATRREPTLEQIYALWNLGFDGFRRRGFLLERTPKITQRAAKKFAILAGKGTI